MQKDFTEYKYNGINAFVYEKCTSTNTLAKKYALENRHTDKCIFIAKEQTGGRGRLGKSFLSPKGGLYISLILRKQIPLEKTTRITTDTAVKLCRVIEELTDLKCGIKWVNDIYVNGKKLCGILTEAQRDQNGNAEFTVIGIGLNIKDISGEKEIADIATSLESECGIMTPDFKTLTEKIIDAVYSENECLNEEYVSRSILTGKRVSVNDFSSTYSASVLGIDNELALIVKSDDGTVKRLSSADVSIKPSD